ncbi:MAG: tyrosine-type recombinase/integrase, partial [Rhizobiales bacterium]|nr:tyrosine-type recombinase/integrase [Hyphomicrobiales bacterium]
ELAAFVDAIEDEHLARYIWLSMATAARPAAILELTRDRCHVDGRYFEMNPIGRLQTKKHRPMIRMAECLVPMVEAVRFGPMVTKGGKPLKAIRSVWNRTRDRAGLPEDFTPYIIRHTVATWLRSQRMPFEEIEQFLGHRRNSTTEDYIHVDVTIQQNAAIAIDRLIAENRPGGCPTDLQIFNRLRDNCVSGFHATCAKSLESGGRYWD